VNLTPAAAGDGPAEDIGAGSDIDGADTAGAAEGAFASSAAAAFASSSCLRSNFTCAESATIKARLYCTLLVIRKLSCPLFPLVLHRAVHQF
jgi:hypothetical protein